MAFLFRLSSMKRLICLITGCMLMACQGSRPKSDAEANPNSVQEWLTFDGKPDLPHIVLISGDEEYRSEEALPQLAKILSTRHGFNCTVLFAQDPEKAGIINPNYTRNIPGLEHLKRADLMIIFTRFRALPDSQMQYIDEYLKRGKPVIGMRTATHAFNFAKVDSISKWKYYGNYYEGDDEWNGGFGRLVLGEKWIAHHGRHKHQSTRGIAAPGMEKHPILNGIRQGDIWGPTDVYAVRLPLPDGTEPLVMGQVINRAGDYLENDPLYGMRSTDSVIAGTEVEKDNDGKETKINRNDPMMPVAWLKPYQIPGGKQGNAMTTTMGAATDLLAEGTRRMIVNGVFWCLGLTVPEKADVELVGDFQPSAYAFKDDQYWTNRKLSVSSMH